MAAIKPLLLIAIGVFCLIAQMIYFLKDDRTDNTDSKDRSLKLKWHLAGAGLKGWMYSMIWICYGYQYALLMAATTWFFFDGVINEVVLKKGWFYVGTTDPLDTGQQKIAKLLQIDVELFSAILKTLFVLISFIISIYGRL